MSDFEKEYKRLNPQQRAAVDAIDGPVIVTAGPGTGKTQLLSMRVANILKKTDTAPQNILCLTFTDSAASTMRQRLLELIGQAAYDVNIHTFHSFGSEIISRYPQYFYSGARMTPASELQTHLILEQIFEELAHDDLLALKFNSEFSLISDTKQAITNLKKADIDSSQLKEIINQNQDFINKVEPIIAKAFEVARFSKKQIPKVQKALNQISKVKSKSDTYRKIFITSLETALESGESSKLVAWRNEWLSKNESGEYQFKDRANNPRLLSLANVYEQYNQLMHQKRLFDFDDMVLEAVRGLREQSELKAELQEQYQYFLVDEFQDTNNAQLHLLKTIIDHPVNEGRPNLLVVGDSKQAIYRFQGAQTANIQSLMQDLVAPAKFELVTNYRSTSSLIQAASHLAKELGSSVNQKSVVDKSGSKVQRFSYPDKEYELSQITNQIQELHQKGIDWNEIAVIGRRHRDLEELMPYLRAADIPTSYERRHNILDEEPIHQLNQFARLVQALSQDDHQTANQLAPEVFSFPFWNIEATKLWKISLDAYKNRITWLEQMATDNTLESMVEQVISLAAQARHASAEVMLDALVGLRLDSEEPGQYAKHYFSEHQQQEDLNNYLNRLSALKLLRRTFRGHHTAPYPKLEDYLEFVDLHLSTNTPILDHSSHREGDQSLNVLTAHKAKGREFEAVFILSANDEIWGSRARGRRRILKMPRNLPIEPAGDDISDRQRLLYVAMTRAKSILTISDHQTDSQGKALLPVRFLSSSDLPVAKSVDKTVALNLKSLSSNWQQWYSKDITDNKELLGKRLETYRLSPTHLNNFLDVHGGGPRSWFLNSFLKFPQSIAAPAAYGSAMHSTLNWLHQRKVNHQPKPKAKDVFDTFTSHFDHRTLTNSELEKYNSKAQDAIYVILKFYYNEIDESDDFEVDLSFVDPDSGVRLTGKIDQLKKLPAKTLEVIDFKTGKSAKDWQGKNVYEKIKLHKYRQQLVFYNLLLGKSSKYTNSKLTSSALIFVEGADNLKLKAEISKDEIDRLKQLIEAVWKKIINFDLPDISKYDASIKGLLEFEQDLIDGNI